MKANEATFHTGWFIESVLSASLVVFALRTRLPLGKNLPSRMMLQMTGLVGLVTLLLPYSPLAGLLGFVPLPPVFLGWMLVIVGVYFGAAEWGKRWFFAHVTI